MGIVVERDAARTVLVEEAGKDSRGEGSPESWVRDISALSEACAGASRTHIAMLGTALLAKATDLRADAFSVKEGAGTPGAYSARGLGHGVLVPNAPMLGIHLGVTGREPLNNQPYFRVKRATERELLPLVRGYAQEPVKILVRLLTLLDKVTSAAEARAALRAFIHVRRRYRQRYPTSAQSPALVTPPQLIDLIERLVAADSEGGKRAQAVAAGIMDAVAGDPALIVAKHINDPDRHFAGDVGVLVAVGDADWARVFEVRDKPVAADDITLFAAKLAEGGFRRGSVLAVAKSQKKIETSAATQWAAEKGVHLVVYLGWRSFLEQALFWSHVPAQDACVSAYRHIRERLIVVEASRDAVQLWDRS